MTISPPALPGSFGYGHVVGQVIHAIADTANDADRNPESRAASGAIQFDPLDEVRRVTTTPAAFVLSGSLAFQLNSDGEMVDQSGEVGVWLVAGAYHVSFMIAGGTKIPGFDIEVTTAHTLAAPLDLATVAPYTPPTGVAVTTLLVPAGPVDGYGLGWSSGALAWVPSVLVPQSLVDQAEAARDEAVAAASKIGVVAGVTPLTDGDIVTLGRWASSTRADINMAILAGGGDNGTENVIGGNLANVNTSTSNLTGAPVLTDNDGNWCFILSGYDNVANGWAVILNGFHNKVAQGGNHATISGGSIHSIGACNYATIGGGTGNSVSDGASGATIGGGVSNTVSGATATSATIAGGNTNTASQIRATVGGGNANTASGNGSTVAGGDTNTASGTGASVVGGVSNTASGGWAVASGRGAAATANGMRAHGAMFSTPGDAQDASVILKAELATVVQTSLSLDGSGALLIPENTTWAISALVVGRRADADGENAAWRIETVAKRDAGSTTALVGTPAVVSLGANAGNVWAATITTNTAGNVNVRVTGEDAKTIRWVASLRIVQVQG